MTRRLGLALAIFATLAPAVFVAGAASAQSRGGYFVFEEEEITGEIQLPEVQIFISRQNLNTDYDLTLDESFLPKIVDAVRFEPF